MQELYTFNYFDEKHKKMAVYQHVYSTILEDLAFIALQKSDKE